MNNQNITNCGLISPSTSNNFSVISINTSSVTSNSNIPSPYNSQFCLLTNTGQLQFYSSFFNQWQTIAS